MEQRVVRVAPLQIGKVFAAMYGIISILLVPFFMILLRLDSKNAPPIWIGFLLVPTYVVLGFVVTTAMAWLYNLVARWVGGIELTVEAKN